MNRIVSALLAAASLAVAAADHVGGPTYEGRTIVCDLPQSELLRNSGGSDGPRGPGSGSGLCVFTSIDRAARWGNNPVLTGFRDWMEHYPGGGYPEKVDQMIAKRYAEYKKSNPDAKPPRYLQNTTGDVSLLELALKTGRMVCVTYGYSPRYGKNIAHMVNLVYLDAEWACVGDNNFPGMEEYEWVPRGEFLRRWNLGGGGWSVVLLDVPAPPAPRN